VVEPGKVPVPLIDNAPGPVHGRPVSGFVPVVLDRSPVGVAGEMLSSDRAGKSVLCPLNTGLTVFPLSVGLLVFCASAAVAVRVMRPMPIIPVRCATMINLPDSGVRNVE
jgi:hypothetical protein